MLIVRRLKTKNSISLILNHTQFDTNDTKNNICLCPFLLKCDPLTAAEPAVMHVISGFPDITAADAIRYTQYRLRYNTDPIIIHSLIPRVAGCARD